MLNLHFSAFTSITGSLLALLGTSIVIWFLVRLKRQKIWLPTLRVIEEERKQVPKLTFVPPPLLSFLMFLLAALVMAFFTLKPTRTIEADKSPKGENYHVLVDLSPSVARDLDMSTYSQRIDSMVRSIGKENSITISTSHGDTVAFSEDMNLQKYLTDLGFHRSGIKISKWMAKYLQAGQKIDKLIIVSDADLHSWKDFNWTFLKENTDFFYYPSHFEDSSRPVNFFVNKAEFTSAPFSPTIDWEIEILANQPLENDVSGTLKVAYGQNVLKETPWYMQAGTRQTQVKVDWPETSLNSRMLANEQFLKWELVVNDGLAMDNTYFTSASGIKQELLVISHPIGENFLDNPNHHISTSLETLGFKVRAFDKAPDENFDYEHYPLWILLGGLDSEGTSFCPSINGDQGLSKGGVTKIWLAPHGENSNYSYLCKCLTQLSGITSEFCSDVRSREDWIAALTSFDAKQVGGNVGKALESIAWKYVPRDKGVEILAFTVPLRPFAGTNISYLKFPLFIKNVLEWQNVIKSGELEKKDLIPRIDDISTAADVVEPTNVPMGESLLATLESESLPPLWYPGDSNAAENLSAGQFKSDPTFWIKICIAVVALASVIEAIGKFFFLAAKARRKRAAAGAAVVLLAFGFSDDGSASIYLNMVGYPKTEYSSAFIAKEVSGRTSITISDKIYFSDTVQKDTLQHPWIWAFNPHAVTQNGKIKSDLVSWIYRGGLLIIENATSLEELKGLTEGVNQLDGQWQVIPPDHELMRSFHLLDTLPVCENQYWWGYHYDGRLALLAAPFSLANALLTNQRTETCFGTQSHENDVRTFINILMVALTTDYKKDQIHLPEILKRLR
ncbi:MAG: DUF4159 domain-containing protein [Oligoflexales bacterium]